MDFEGRVIQYLGETGGTSKAGKPWKKREWVVETFGQYPRKVKVQSFNERAESLNLEPGKDYILSVDLESREFNGRWYTDVSVFRVQEYQGQPMGSPAPYGGQPQGFQGGFQAGGQQPFGAAPFNTAQGGVQEGFSENFSATVEESDEDLPF